MSISGLSIVTSGLSRTPGQPSQLLTGGIPYAAAPAPPLPNQQEITRGLNIGALNPGLQGANLDALSGIRSFNPPTTSIVPTPTGYVDLGPGYNVSFDPDTQQGKILPVLGNVTSSADDSFLGSPAFSYSGSDIKIIIEATSIPQQGNVPPRLSKQLLECTTITVSIHRAKAGACAAGYSGHKGFARGRRTIAGTLVLTQFATDVLLRFLHSAILQQDTNKDSHYSKIDQLPPFNMTLLFTNEYGFASYCRLLGVEMMTSGTVYSHNDMYTEQTMSYMASDLTPLLPLTASGLNKKPPADRRSNAEKTVQDVWTPPPGPADPGTSSA